MKKILILITLFISFMVCANNDRTSSNDISDVLTNGIDASYDTLKILHQILTKNSIDIFYSDWENVVEKKCSWVGNHSNIELYGQEDLVSRPSCILIEQNSFINELILLLPHLNISVDLALQQYKTNLSEQKQHNIYFNLLTEKYANKFCHAFYSDNKINDCINRFLSTQYIPADYGFKIATDQSYLFNTPHYQDKTAMYLIKGQDVDVLDYENGYYQINYVTQKNKIVQKWLHCSAIAACM
jgi:hypothetical protein